MNNPESAKKVDQPETPSINHLQNDDQDTSEYYNSCRQASLADNIDLPDIKNETKMYQGEPKKIDKKMPRGSIPDIFDKIKTKQQLEVTKHYQKQLMLILTSSAEKQSLDKLTRKKSLPLHSINYDIDLLVEKLKNYRLIEGSKDQKIILSKEYVMNWFIKYFRRPVLNFYFFYTGHGLKYENPKYKGCIILQNSQNSQYICLQEIVKIFNQNVLCNQSHLYIFLDSCYAGNWCFKHRENYQQNISIFAATDQINEADDNKTSGGDFLTTIFGEESNFKENFKKLNKQSPMFISKSNRCAPLTQAHLKVLQQNFRNAQKFDSSTDTIQVKNFPKIKSQKEIYEQEKQKLYKQMKENKEQEMKQRYKLKQMISKLQKQNHELIQNQKQSDLMRASLTNSLMVDISQQKKEIYNISSTITLMKRVSNVSYLFGKNFIRGQYTFTAVFNKILTSVGLGVVDILYKDQPYLGQNRISYDSEGNYYIGSQMIDKLKGFKSGQQVTMVIVPDNGYIYWSVGNNRYSFNVRMLKNKRICWVPLIWLTHAGDSVQLTQC